MDGFKNNTKMKCFKEGGSVKYESRKEHKEEMSADIKQDKKIVKKAIAMHDKQEHKGEKTDLSKLKKGGRAKKAAGTVKKFEKASGEYGAKKTAQDKKNIKEAKLFKPKFKDGGKACAPSAAKKAKMCGGGKAVPKYSGKDGSYVDVKNPQALTDKIAQEENEADANILPNAYKAVKRIGKQVIKTAKDAFTGQGAVSDVERSNIAKKKGGKVKKYAEGGAVLSDEEKAWLGGADATDPFILARMRSALGDKKPAMQAGPPAAAPSAPVAAYQAPNVEQDSGLAYPQENELRTAPMAPPVRRRPVLPTGPSADDRMRMKNARPYVAPNVEQDSGLEYPVKPGFFNATPGQQATQFNRGAQQRKNVGRSLGELFGLNKKPGV
jgi:hypothetical protein